MPDIEVTISTPKIEATISGTHPSVEVNLGTKGDTGLAGAGFNYVHTQDIAALVWNIAHGLNGYPNVTTVDSSGQEVLGDVEYTDANNIEVTFAYLTGGKAYLS